MPIGLLRPWDWTVRLLRVGGRREPLSPCPRLWRRWGRRLLPHLRRGKRWFHCVVGLGHDRLPLSHHVSVLLNFLVFLLILTVTVTVSLLLRLILALRYSHEAVVEVVVIKRGGLAGWVVVAWGRLLLFLLLRGVGRRGRRRDGLSSVVLLTGAEALRNGGQSPFAADGVV